MGSGDESLAKYLQGYGPVWRFRNALTKTERALIVVALLYIVGVIIVFLAAYRDTTDR